MAKCVIHEGFVADGGTCQKCRNCKHENFWMSESDYNKGVFRCNGCVKLFKKVPRTKEVWVLLGAKWVDYWTLVDQSEVAKIEKEVVVEEEHEVVRCGNEECDVIFGPGQTRKKFCSDACKERFRYLSRKNEKAIAEK